MLVRGVVTYPRPASEFTEGELETLRFVEDFERGSDDSAA
jgi:hypothetical protein